MILRMWRAQSTVEKADEYVRHATTKVFPALRAIEGHRGADLLRHTQGDTVELVVLTLWESMDAVRKFAGTEPESSRCRARRPSRFDLLRRFRNAFRCDSPARNVADLSHK